MGFLRQISDNRTFSRRYPQFERLFELSQKIFHEEQNLSSSSIKKIAHLNRRRENIQRKIGELDLDSLSTCSECKGSCCQDNTEDYFTIIDFLISEGV